MRKDRSFIITCLASMEIGATTGLTRILVIVVVVVFFFAETICLIVLWRDHGSA